MFEIDPDKPNIPALARILSGIGVLCLIGSVVAALLAFSDYDWLSEGSAMAGSVGAFLLALVFFGQAKILELLAVVSARVKSRFAIDAIAKAASAPSLMPASTPGAPPTPRPNVITQPVKERIIHVSEEQAREQGFKVR